MVSPEAFSESQAIQTPQPPQPPQTPFIAHQALQDLVKYYRELVAYHSSSIDYHKEKLEQHTAQKEAAATQLASIETILFPLSSTEVPSSTLNGINKKGKSNEAALPKKDRSEAEPSIKNPTDSTEIKPVKSIKSAPKTAKTNKSKDNQNKNKTKISKTKTKTKSVTVPNQVQKPSSNSKLPPSEKLDIYLTIKDAVTAYLKERSPKIVTARDVVDYFYPDGLNAEQMKRVQNSFSTCLSKGQGKHGWIRTAVGKYRWENR